MQRLSPSRTPTTLNFSLVRDKESLRQVYPEPSQTATMENLAKNGYQLSAVHYFCEKVHLRCLTYC